MIVVGQWTGQEASALRQALRMTIPEFAERLGVAGRTVAKWEAHGSAIVPVPVLQAVLDTVLARAADAIGETDENQRCLDLLDDCDPAARSALGL